MLLKVSLNQIELDPESFHILIETEINSTKAYLVIDTGASKSVFTTGLDASLYTVQEIEDESKFESAGIGQGELTTDNVILNSMIIGGQTFQNIPAVLIDIDHINQIYHKHFNMEITGLLGSDFLVKYNAVIDYKSKEILLELP